ncbi:hypothetical protein [Pilimelia columellifera]
MQRLSRTTTLLTVAAVSVATLTGLTALPAAAQPDSTVPAQELNNATLSIPPLAGEPQCPSGQVKFTNGRATAGELVELVLGKPVNTNLDGDAAGETAVLVTCAGVTSVGQIIAVERADAGIVALGRVVGPRADVRDVTGVKAAKDGGVVATVADHAPLDGDSAQPQTQGRTFIWKAGRYVQSAGPKHFPLRDDSTDIGLVTGGVVTKVVGGVVSGSLTAVVSNVGPRASTGQMIVLDVKGWKITSDDVTCQNPDVGTQVCRREEPLEPGESARLRFAMRAEAGSKPAATGTARVKLIEGMTVDTNLDNDMSPIRTRAA